ncbi:hypothetical protein F4782DRAFT_526652 [Xylaria castorea]|nr:hypothetical protein F4782DRAFT_526652 [Xylaria castorea]
MASFTITGIFAGYASHVDGLGALRNLLVLGFGIGIPLFCATVYFKIQKRRPQSSDMADDDETEMDNTINCIWSSPICVT